MRETLVEAIRAGLTKELASQSAMIGNSTFMLWLQDGRLHRDKGRKPLPYTPGPIKDHKTNEREVGKYAAKTSAKYSIQLELLEAIEKVEADRIHENLLLIRQSAIGGAVVETTTTTTVDKLGNRTTVTKVKKTNPAWQAAAWLTERTKQADYGLKYGDGGIGGGEGSDDVLRVTFAVVEKKKDGEKENGNGDQARQQQEGKEGKHNGSGVE